MTLRWRLVLGLLTLTAAGLAIAATLTYVALESFLIGRADDQLDLIAGPVESALRSSTSEGLFVGDRVQDVATRVALPPGSYGELRTADGALQVGAAVEDVEEAIWLPEIPAALPGSGSDDDLQRLTVQAKTRAHGMRVRAAALAGGGTIIVAVPLDGAEATLTRLVTIELAVSAGVLVAVALGGLLYVRRSLLPLERVAATADAIAAGDLSPRLEEGQRASEVGRMARALNAMFGRLEHAFAEQHASEDRLRRFIADASHELRTPLTSIRGYAELFRMGATTDPDDLANAMRRIEEESTRMSAMVEDLLLLARLDEGPELQRAPVDLAVIARDVVADAHAAQPERAIALDVPEELHLLGDEPRLRQVAANLLANTRVHTPVDADVSVVVCRHGDDAILEVHDEGPGLDDVQAARVFERFNRGDPGRARQGGAGTGLGLAIVAAIVEAHGGTVALETAVGAGCTFRVTLPVGREQES